jgi:lipopolysaccharide export system permease protein
VKISALTAKIQISFVELLTLYSYSVPDVIFYTLPLSFIAALTNVLIRLSQDNELIALYALGLNAQKLLRSIFILGLLFSLLLFVISFLAMPLTKQYYKSFKEEKKAEVKLNIVAGKLGQKFGNYYIYVEEKKDNKLKNIVIYNRTDQKSEQFFSSQEGEMKHQKNTTSLLLNDGYGYTYSNETLQQAKYKTLEVYDSINKRAFQFEDLLAYWGKALHDKNMMHRVLFFMFVSFIPLLSIYLVSSFSMINPRYQANRTFMIIFGITFLLYALASALEKWGTPLLLIVTIIAIASLGKWLFKKRVAKYF